MTSLPASDRQHDLDLALSAVDAGLAVVRGADDRAVLRLKGPNDLVTAVDLATEDAVVRTLREGSPLPVQGEEGSPQEDADDRWVVDPIDGTANFVAGLPLVACTLARLSGGEPVVGVTADVTTGEVVWGAYGAGTWRRAAGRDVRVSTVGVAGVRERGLGRRGGCRAGPRGGRGRHGCAG